MPFSDLIGVFDQTPDGKLYQEFNEFNDPAALDEALDAARAFAEGIRKLHDDVFVEQRNTRVYIERVKEPCPV